jgi:hypothetical protein
MDGCLLEDEWEGLYTEPVFSLWLGDGSTWWR